jgi:Ran GTPase-activating protein (RanGAP) involved in mRNA processing and transport
MPALRALNLNGNRFSAAAVDALRAAFAEDVISSLSDNEEEEGDEEGDDDAAAGGDAAAAAAAGEALSKLRV